MNMQILLVDDEEGIRKVLGIALADQGYDVLTAGNARQALTLFDAVAPSIVLTDIKMPGMDGIDLLKEIKRRRPDTEVIMITGHGDMDLAVKSLKSEATDYITKPIDDETLEVALMRAHERIAMREQLQHYTENLERLVEEKSQQLVQAERLAAMGETVAGLAHAIKNIAGGLKGGAFVVEKGIALDNRKYLRQGWQMTKESVERIEQLALDLLNIAKPGRPSFERIDPNQPLQEVYALIAPQAEQFGIRLTLEAAQGLEPIDMEPKGIYRCILNLASNAVDACMQCGAHNKKLGIELRSQIDDQGIQYHVSDNCGGMDEAIEARLFKGFFTTKGSQGTGIGLMLTRKIVETHQGRISVQSQPGQGSKFSIWLPSRQANQSAH